MNRMEMNGASLGVPCRRCYQMVDHVALRSSENVNKQCHDPSLARQGARSKPGGIHCQARHRSSLQRLAGLPCHFLYCLSRSGDE